MGERFEIVKFLKAAVAAGASDEHLKAGLPPFIRKNGIIMQASKTCLQKDELEDVIVEIVPFALKEEIFNRCDVDFMYEIPGVSRFRVNYNRQLGNPALVIRNIPYSIPTLQDLMLPDVFNEFVKYQNGLVLVTGPTGCGKSTTLAAMINTIATNCSKHIVTIEDPVEYIFTSNKSIISQRQVEVDTKTFSDGIKYALRQDPDIIFIGEIRDKTTLEAALKAAETGHLVLSTLHTNDAVQTINRIVNMFEEDKRPIIRSQLAETLRATIAQKLVYSEQNKKRYPACEIMVVTSTIKDYILKDNCEAIYELMSSNNIDDMISMNSSLATLVEDNCLTQEEALANSNDVNELEKIFRGVYQGTKAYYE